MTAVSATVTGMSDAIQGRGTCVLCHDLDAGDGDPVCPGGGSTTRSLSRVSGHTCDEWVTDIVGVVGDDARLEATVDRIVARFGHQIAVVVISSTGGTDPSSYAAGNSGIGGGWGTHLETTGS